MQGETTPTTTPYGITPWGSTPDNSVGRANLEIKKLNYAQNIFRFR